MRRRLLGTLIAVALTVGALVMPSAASAAPMTREEFTAALGAASVASTAFAKGTTVVVSVASLLSMEMIETTVNPNGSAVVTQTSLADGVERITCVRVDRCWERSDSAYGNLKWHRLPAGAVTYEQASGLWAAAADMPWPEGTTFDASAQPDGTQVFAAVVKDQDDVLTSTYTVNGPSLRFDMSAIEVSALEAGGSPDPLLTVTISAQGSPIVVVAPTPRTIGAASTAGTRWTAPINS